MPAKIAVIGAGISGLALAQRLSEVANVQVFEKSRGPGGRMAARYTDPYRFDHGTQHFTARGEAFKVFIQPLLDAGVIAPWHARFTELTAGEPLVIRQWGDDYPHYVGVPGMNRVGRFLAEGLHAHYKTRVTEIGNNSDRWHLITEDEETHEGFDWVLSSAPAEQSHALLPEAFAHHNALAKVTMLGCYALMLGLAEDVEREFDAAVVKNSDISWVAVNSSKPQRAAAPCVLVHASNAWADTHMTTPLEDIEAHMTKTVIEQTGWDLNIRHSACHRWRFANIDPQTGPLFFADAQNGLAAFGDWCVRGRVEAAFTSAMALADELEAALKQ